MSGRFCSAKLPRAERPTPEITLSLRARHPPNAVSCSESTSLAKTAEKTAHESYAIDGIFMRAVA